MTHPTSTSIGAQAEQLALAHLQKHELILITQNWRCRFGELDLVMRDGATLVFIEVRFRQHQAWGGALASVDARKQHKIIVTAQHFLQKEPRWRHLACRFDVIAVRPEKTSASMHIEWLKNAFALS